MSTREIAELTGKEHRHVMRDAREMLEQLGEDVSSFGQMSPDAYGRPQPVLNLPKDLTLTLVAGYSVPLRHHIVTRPKNRRLGRSLQHHQIPRRLKRKTPLAATGSGRRLGQLPASVGRPWGGCSALFPRCP